MDVTTGETILLDTRGQIATKSSDADVAAGKPNIEGTGTTKTHFRARLGAPTTAPAQ